MTVENASPVLKKSTFTSSTGDKFTSYSTGDCYQCPSDFTIHSPNGTTHFPSGGTFFTASGEDSETASIPTLDVTFSVATFLDLGVSGGTWQVGGTLVDFKASLVGCCKMIAHKIDANTHVDISGSSEFSATEITAGNINATISGSRTIQVGRVEVENATFSVSGSGSVALHEGKVLNLLDVCVPGNGNFCFRGQAQNARLVANGRGSIEVDKVIDETYKEANGFGSIVIGQPSQHQQPHFNFHASAMEGARTVMEDARIARETAMEGAHAAMEGANLSGAFAGFNHPPFSDN